MVLTLGRRMTFSTGTGTRPCLARSARTGEAKVGAAVLCCNCCCVGHMGLPHTVQHELGTESALAAAAAAAGATDWPHCT